ncbi:MAG: SH3 domain-containing protein, partial [Clostridia bacterium]|nr:SH3 domain-containing protein [Clostridia bacterium]
NIRAKASSSSRSLGKAHNGDVFQVLGVTGRWVKVWYDGGVAYIYDHYVKLSDGPVPPKPDPPIEPTPPKKAYIVNVRTHVNVRKAPTSNSVKLGTLVPGAEVTVTGTSGNWTRIDFVGGSAFVYSRYVSVKKPDADVIGKTATIVNCVNFVNIRAKANGSSRKLGQAWRGTTYTVRGISGNWVQVDYDGGSAFIYNRYVKIG